MRYLLLLIRFWLCLAVIFIVQKVFFMSVTWPEGILWTDVPQVILHGLKLDQAVSGYLLVLPFLLAVAAGSLGGRWLNCAIRCYWGFVALLLATIITADASLYPFWHFKLDASVFLYTDKPQDAMASVNGGFIAVRLLWLMLWCIGIWLMGRWLIFGGATAPAHARRSGGQVLSLSLAYLGIGALLFLMIRGGVGKGTNNVSAAYYSDNQYLNHASVNPAFNLLYSLGKQEDFANEAQYYDDAECARLIDGIFDTQSVAPDTLLRNDRPNILLIIWEGGGDQLRHIDGVTPQLNAWAQQGIDFTNCYASSFRTDRGQLSLLSGWLAIPKTSLMKIPEKCDHLPALPRQLLAQGYRTTFWYGGDISFANTGGYMHQAGFQRNVSEDDFARSERATDWGVYDGTLLDRMTATILQDDSSAPYLHTVMTLSSHEPWQVPIQQFDDERLNAFHYTDQCIGRMLTQLKASPQWDNLLVIITSDHGVPLNENQGLHFPEVTHIPMVWTGGAIAQPRQIHTLMSQCDLAATLLSQLHLGHEAFTFSRDVMSQSYTYPSIFNAYNGGISFADSTGYSTFDIDGERAILNPDEVRISKAKAILQMLYRSIANL